MQDSISSCDVLFFTSMPNLKELCSITICIPPSGKNSENVNALEPHIIKCREIIFTEPDVLASPILGAREKVKIIMQGRVYKTGQLQTRLQRMNIQIEQGKSVSAAEFQSCLQYTLCARVAPLWNKMGKYLVQGRDFVTSRQRMNAVSLNVTVSNSELYLRLSANVIKCPPITLSDLDLCGPVIESFLQTSTPEKKIEEYSIGNKWCYVLPSMKKGQVVNILKDIPSDGPFSCYKSMKKYWKNMYGYRLPETEEGMLYCQIYFKPIGHRLFTYPQYCVRLRELSFFNCPNTNVVFKQFLEDFQMKMPSVCGHKMIIQSKAMHPLPHLNMVSSQNNSLSMANLSVENNANVKSQYRCQENIYKSQQFTPSKSKLSQIPESCKSSNLCSQKRVSLPLPKQLSNSDENKSKKSNGNDSLGEPQRNANLTASTNDVLVKKITPMFTSKSSTGGRNLLDVYSNSICEVSNIRDDTKEKKMIPMFSSKFSKSTVPDKVTQIKNDIRKIPIFGKSQNWDTYHGEKITCNDKNSSQNRTYYADLPTFEHSNPQIPSRNKFSTSRKYIGQKDLKTLIPNITSFKQKVHMASSTNVSVQTSMKPPNGTGSSANHIQPICSAPVKLKRKGEVPGDVVKKPRMRTKVQEGVDIPHMARTNQLATLNTQTLLMWLKSHGVPCRSKDKKAILVDKVLTLLQIAKAEQ